jgi:hypothetical protein
VASHNHLPVHLLLLSDSSCVHVAEQRGCATNDDSIHNESNEVAHYHEGILSCVGGLHVVTKCNCQRKLNSLIV